MKLFSLTLISVVSCFLSSCDGGHVYKVMTITGNHSVGGTGAQVFIGVRGPNGFSGMISLPMGWYFSPDRAKVFNITAPIDVGVVTEMKITLFHYQRKSVKENDFWLLTGIVLYDNVRQKLQWFEANQWLNATFTHNVTISLSPKGPGDYNVIVETGDQKGAGTHGKVYITLLGSEGNSRKILLDHEGKSEFQRGQIDTFIISIEEDIGDVAMIRIELDSSADSHSPNWFLKAVSLVDEASKHEQWFPWNQWLTPTLDQKKISVEIPVSTY